MRVTAIRVLFLGLMLAAPAIIASAQEPTPEPPQTPVGGGGRGFGGAAVSQDPQPYDKVITKDAKTKKGVFSVHQVKDKYYYEIPKSELGKEFLLVSQIQRTTNGVGYGGQALGSRVVKWELGEVIAADLFRLLLVAHIEQHVAQLEAALA